MDGGRFVTLPLVVTRDPRHGKRNMGMYRMQVYDGQTTGMHWQRQKVAAEHFRERLRMAAESGATGSAAAARVDMMAQTAGGSVQFDGGSVRLTGGIAAGSFAGMPAVTTAD